MTTNIIIILLFIGVVVSLFSSLTFLFKDTEIPESKRTLYALGVRITLAALLLGFIGYKINSGEIRNTAPWDNQQRLNNPPTETNK